MLRSFRSLLAVAFAALWMLASGAAFAVPISYLYWGEADGTLAEQAFQGESFLITAKADTANIGGWCCSQQQNTHSSATITLGNLGTFTFTALSHTWTGTNCCVGIGANLAGNWLTIFSATIGTDILGTNVGPIFDPYAFTNLRMVNIGTSGGALTISSLVNGGATFQAAVVPEPGTYALMLAGLGGIGLMMRLRSRG